MPQISPLPTYFISVLALDKKKTFKQIKKTNFFPDGLWRAGAGRRNTQREAEGGKLCQWSGAGFYGRSHEYAELENCRKESVNRLRRDNKKQCVTLLHSKEKLSAGSGEKRKSGMCLRRRCIFRIIIIKTIVERISTLMLVFWLPVCVTFSI